MKPSLILFLLLFLVACDPVDTTPTADAPEPSITHTVSVTPSQTATVLHPAFQTATDARATNIARGTQTPPPTSDLFGSATVAAATREFLAPTRTEAALIATPLHDGYICTWIPIYDEIRVRTCPAARCEVMMVLGNDVIQTTGQYVYEWHEEYGYVHVDIAGVNRVKGWAEWRYFPSPPLTYVDLWRPGDNCNVPATPTPEAPQNETWTLLQRILPTNEPLTNLTVRQPVNGQCIAGATIVGRLAFDVNNEANNRFVLSADYVTSGGNRYHVIQEGVYAGKCVAVEGNGLTFMVRVG